MPPEEDCDLVDDPQSCPLHCDLRQELMTMDGAAHSGELILPFLEAAAKGDVEEVIRSLRIDPTLINTHHPETGNTALIAAAEENRSEVIALLLEHGADVTASNFANQTAAHVANDGVRAQLLSAVTRTSFPELSMMQGDLERVKYLQSIGHGHYLHNRNGQGLTPAMLLLRDVDLFDNLQTTGSDYQTVAVLQELLRHHVDTDLLDTITNVSDMTSPLRRQLMDALETPETDAHDDASCDLCLNTKPPLCVAPPAIQNQSSEEVSGDGISNDLVEEQLDPAAGPGAKAELQEEIYFQEMENIHQTQGRKRNSISRRWVTDPTPEHLTRQSSLKRQPSLPPLHMRTGGEVSKLEGLGLGYLVQESYSEPNVLDCDYNPDPLCNIKSIKGHIWQRLASSESSRDSKTFPPLSHSPRSLLPTRLRPLSKTHLRNKGGHRSRTAVSCDEPDDSGIEGSPCEEKLQKSLQTSEDMILSRDLVHISLDCCICSGNQKSHREDCAKTAEGRSRTESGRRETVAERETPRIHISCRDLKPLLHTNGEAQARNCREMAASSLHLELGHGESFKKNRTSDMEEENVPGLRDDKQLEIQRSEDKLETATSNNEESKKVELKIMDSSRSPRTGHVPFVHITFSEQEPEREANCSPCKPLFTKRKTKPGSLLLNGNHSFNVLAQKENEKTKKNRKGRIMSAPDTTKQQRPLSNSNRGHGKNVPLPTLVYSSVPSPTKVAKKVAYPAKESTDRSIQRSQTQLTLYAPKRINSPSNPPMLPRSKSSHDFQDIQYSDMFVEITSQQGSGPAMYQMFPPTVYDNAFNPCRETNSASSSRTRSSKGSRANSSRDSSARSKRTKPKSKKTSSASSHRRRNSSSKLEVIEKAQNKTENTVIISGVDWEIKAEKQNGGNIKFPLDGMMDIKNQNFELTTINEATIENSITSQTVKETLKTSREPERRSNKMESDDPKSGDVGLLQEMEGLQQDLGVLNSNCHRDSSHNVQAPRSGRTTPPNCDLNPTQANPQPQQDQGLGDLVNDDKTRVSENNTEDEECTSQNIQGAQSLTGSEQLTDDLISCLKKLIIDKEAIGSLPDESEGEESGHFREWQDVDDENEPRDVEPVSTNQSLTDHKSGTNFTPTANSSGPQPHEKSMHWIKGEVLGRGAYGTVYRGLTSQGELIAAKQVILHGSDPAVAEKEYRKLQEEVDLLKTLKHVNIVGYLGTSFEDRIVTIFMEYVPGGSISNILRHFGPLQEVVTSRYTHHILRGISYLHRNRVVHRDIKGNNVVLMPNGVIKLIDFGCAKRLNGLSVNGTHGEMLQSMHGTPYWMAPEVISESGHGEKSDIWSIGCTVFEMATGKPPLAHMERMAAMFYIGVEKGLMPTLPDHFSRKAREFVNLCLTRDQEKRPSAEQLLQHPFVRWTS